MVPRLRAFRNGFTLLELLTVIVIISILSLLGSAVFMGWEGKAARAACQSNLRVLYTGAPAYLTDNEVWPQIPTTDIHDPQYAIAWVKVFQPYGVAPKNWICPAVQKALGNMDYNQYPRVDYFAMPFGDKPRAAFLYPTQPWFVERADIHGDGNLVIFTNGSTGSVQEILTTMPKDSGAQW